MLSLKSPTSSSRKSCSPKLSSCKVLRFILLEDGNAVWCISSSFNVPLREICPLPQLSISFIRSSSGLNGFKIKSSIPYALQSSFSWAVISAVTTIIGIFFIWGDLLSRICLVISTPLIPGILRSIRIRSILCSSRNFSPAGPSSVTYDLHPHAFNRCLNKRWFILLSSKTRIFLPFIGLSTEIWSLISGFFWGIEDSLPFLNGKLNLKTVPLPNLLWTSMFPFKSSIICLTIFKPRPEPP